MKQEDFISPEGKVSKIESEYFRIIGSKLQISHLQFDHFNLRYEAIGFENEAEYDLPPHIMEQLGEALIKQAFAEYERIENTMRKETKHLLEVEQKKRAKLTLVKS